MHATGAHVFGTVRNIEKGQEVDEGMEKSTEGGKITLIEMELDLLASIMKGVEEILRQTKQLDAVANNAG